MLMLTTTHSLLWHVLGCCGFGLFLIYSLVFGEIRIRRLGVGRHVFTRVDEPVWYWGFIALLVCLTVAFAYLLVRGLAANARARDAWRKSGKARDA
jgi:hypothetical protein